MSAKINLYRCEQCLGAIVTIDRDEGTTPAFLMCRATPGCEGTMLSAWYQCDQTIRPEWEWFRPKNNLSKLSISVREHVERGGLLLRRIPPNADGIDDPNLREIVDYIQTLDLVSAVMLQRKFKVTYMTAARYLDALIERRFIEARKDKLGKHIVRKVEE